MIKYTISFSHRKWVSGSSTVESDAHTWNRGGSQSYMRTEVTF